MRIKIVLGICLSVLFVACKSSKTAGKKEVNEVVYTCGDRPMYMDEFSYVFYKNSKLINDTINDQYIQEYLDRSIRYKLKLSEAYDLKMDTVPAYINELAGYRKTLAKSYLSDKTVTDELMKEAYDRMQTDVRASHVLVMVDPNAKAEDTLKAFEKISSYRNMIVTDGKEFGAIAKEYSEDPSAKDNEGDLGYFTTLQMIYPFENQAYNTKVGDVSNVFRTRFGYHIIKVVDKRPTAGNIKAAHIFLTAFEDNTKEVEAKANAIYEELKAGADFKVLAKKYSEDQGSKPKGGELGIVNSYSNFPSDFKNEIFKLEKDGAYSKPFKSKYGWHIVHRITQEPLATYKQIEYSLNNKISRDSRSSKSKEAVVERIKRESHYTVNKKAKERVFSSVDNSYTLGKWEDKIENREEVLFSFDLQKYTVGEFASFLEKNQRELKNASLNNLLALAYKMYVNTSAMDYEERFLDQTNKDFQNIYREYRDAILVFNISGDKVWNKASEDTVGLKAFFDKNRSNYRWGERLEAVVFNASTKEAAIKAMEMSKAGIAYDTILKKVNNENKLSLMIRKGKFENGDDPIVDKVYEKGNSHGMDNSYVDLGAIEHDQHVIVYVIRHLHSMNKELKETRGPAITDYQKELEDSWLKSLRAKYPVVVNQEVFSKFKTEALKAKAESK